MRLRYRMFTVIGWILAHTTKRKTWRHAKNYGMSLYKFGKLRKVW